MKSLVILISLVVLASALQFEDIHSPVRVPSKLMRNAILGESLTSGKVTPKGEENKDFWLNLAYEEMFQRTQKTLNTNKAKNVIFFLGDGMSLTTLVASRIRKGQLQGNPGEEEQLCFEKFPEMGLSKVSGGLVIIRITKTKHLKSYRPIVLMLKYRTLLAPQLLIYVVLRPILSHWELVPRSTTTIALRAWIQRTTFPP